MNMFAYNITETTNFYMQITIGYNMILNPR